MSQLARHWTAARLALRQEKARARRLVECDETDFLPAALEILERPISPTGRATAWLLLSILVIALLWLTFGKVDVVASAPGRLIPLDNVKIIQSAEAGIVRGILVRDGQHVRKGETLVELDPTVSTADTAQARKALETAQFTAARSTAILAGLDGRPFAFRLPAGAPAEQADVQAALARTRLGEIESTIAVHIADRQTAMAAGAEARGEAAKLAETLPLLDEQIAANEQLLAKGYVSKLKVIEMRRQRLATARDHSIALDSARKAGSQMLSATESIAQARAHARATVLDELITAESEARLRRDELTKASRRSSLQRLTSPVDGIVTQLAVHTIGGVVEPARPIMVIVPIGRRLIGDVKILNKDAGFVRPGQPVAVKLEAFPFTRFGTVAGHIASVSSDAVEDERLGLVYTARIALDRSVIERDGITTPLTPGMAITADIRTGQRTLLHYIVSPLDKARLEAGRER